MKEAKIKDLLPDDRNMNKGTEYGNSLIENSLRKFGAGRSILIDKNNRIIAGNKTIENASQIGIEDIIIVETDGHKIVAVKRNDIDLDTQLGRELALADNATSKANIAWDETELRAIEEDFIIAASDWGVDVDSFNYSEKNQEIDVNGFADEMVLKLTYSESDYNFVKEKLSEISENLEDALLLLLKKE